jgi:hypothetical protein
MKILTVIVALTAFTAAPVFATPADDVQAMLARAESAYQEALALEHGWAVTEPLIAEARAALAGGDLAAAQAIAERALLTAEQSLEQARSERDAWAGRVVQR